MPINHSFSVLMCNFKLVAKLLVFIMIVVLIAAALFVSLIGPVLRDFYTELAGREDFDVSFAANPIKAISKVLEFFISFMANNAGFLSGRFFVLMALFAGVRFFLTLCLMPVSKILHGKMTTGFDTGFNNAFVSSLWQNLLFTLFCSVVITAADAIILIAILYFTLGAVKLMGLLGVPISIMLAIFLYSLRMALVCMWLPEMNNSGQNNIFKSLSAGIRVSLKALRKNLICLTVVNTIMVSLILISVVPTVGVLPILLVPTYLVLYTALCNCLSYSFYQKKYFVDNGVTVYQSTKKY